jgi:hypothetical protein
MIDENEIPASSAERATLMQNLLTARATGDLRADREMYEALRREFMANEVLKPVLPDFVRTCRSLDVFWPYIKGKAGTYAERRHIIAELYALGVDILIWSPYVDRTARLGGTQGRRRQMAQKLEIGDILPIRNKDGVVVARLVYLGGGAVNAERLMQGTTITGGPDNSKDWWRLDKPNQQLSEAQIAAWLAVKE